MKAVRNFGVAFKVAVMLFSLICLLIFSSACSSHRLRHESLVENERLEDRAEWKNLEDSIRAEWLDVREMLRLSEDSRQVWIWPEGEFSFQLDSGFVGSASVLLVEEVERSMQMEGGSGWGRLERVLSVDSATERSELVREMQHENRSESVRSGLLGTGNKALIRSVVVLGLLLLGAIWIWWKWGRRWGRWKRCCRVRDSLR